VVPPELGWFKQNFPAMMRREKASLTLFGQLVSEHSIKIIPLNQVTWP
jgi:hypothetical protein